VKSLRRRGHGCAAVFYFQGRRRIHESFSSMHLQRFLTV
jgi:hypothetical protein